ncbi:hypothetical protein ACFQ4X_07450 [Fictibacillus halophilus]|uniref:hypothetical protein n=1 Tax=Fictibacillus halophilus TaxID=1610490 RepID=UPI0036371A58
MNTKWGKIIIGAVLLIGFVIFTQYEKNAEPAWKVNTENFTVLDSWEELMNFEKMKYNDLKFVDHFNLFKNSDISVPLSNEHRTLRIEKTWNNGFQLYVLYSVDLKERDKDEGDVPSLNVEKIKLTSKQSKDFLGIAELYPGETSSEGYVFKHRLYRSMMIHPEFNNAVNSQEDWEEVMKSNRFELNDITMNSKKGVTNLKPIAFQVEPAQIVGLPKAIESIPVNQTLLVNNGDEIRLKNMEFYQIGSRIMLDKKVDKDLVSLLGEVNVNDRKHTIEYEIESINEAEDYIQAYSLMSELLNSDQSDKGTFSITHSVHRSKNDYSFSVPKIDLEKYNANQAEGVRKNELVVNENDVKVVYEGLYWDNANNQGGIKFSLETLPKQDSLEEEFLYPRPSYHFGEGNMDRYVRNIVAVKNSAGKQLEDYDIAKIFNDGKSSFLIYFYNGLPAEDLSVSLSNLTHIEPLKNKVVVPLKLPPAKK